VKGLLKQAEKNVIFVLTTNEKLPPQPALLLKTNFAKTTAHCLVAGGRPTS
jgi:hypothetical protein